MTTLGDDWTFLRAVVNAIDTDLPVMTVETSREYKEKIEAETILRILKSIMLKYAPIQLVSRHESCDDKIL